MKIYNGMSSTFSQSMDVLKEHISKYPNSTIVTDNEKIYRYITNEWDNVNCNLGSNIVGLYICSSDNDALMLTKPDNIFNSFYDSIVKTQEVVKVGV